MSAKCEKCNTRIKDNKITFICPYSEKEIGLDCSSSCRLKLVKCLQTYKININEVVFTNTKIKKTFKNETIRKYINTIKFLNNIITKIKLKLLYKVSNNFFHNILIEPYETICEILNYKKVIKEFYKDSLLSEILDYIKMEYDKKMVYMRIFENSVDLDERWLNIEKFKIFSKSENSYSIEVIKIGSKYFYYIKLESNEIVDSGSPFKLLERMDGSSNSLRKLIVAMLDQDVQELYLDKENSWVYLDHELYGRCETNIYLNSVDVEKFKTFISILTGEEISVGQPSIKVSIKDEEVKLRIAIDTFPIVEDTSIDIRKFRRRLFSLKELIEKESLPLELAAFLVLCVKNRLSLVICGEPNSGKTTLAHALARHLPVEFRKIYLEDVDEVYSSLENIPHSVYIKTSSIDVAGKYSKKSHEIIKLLHRSPDWIFLGEIQTKEHSKAFFHSILAGLRGLVTCHSKTAEELIARWISQHRISPENICSLDLIVEMKREIIGNKIIRKVNKVYEIYEKNNYPNLNLIYSEKDILTLNKILALKTSLKIMKEKNIEPDGLINEIKNIISDIINGQ
jgi:type IV secretory pathway ATPase VirB11/archaellum biosynthesis ATPase